MSIRRFFRDGNEDYFHSSVHARAASGDRIGATSTQSFNERHLVERNRQIVQRYHDSMVARYNSRTVEHQTEPISPGVDVTSTLHGRGQVPAIPSRPQGFHEPPTRGYNPFA